MNKRLKGLLSRLLIIVMFVGSLGSLQAGVNAEAGGGAGAGGSLASLVIGERTATGAEVTFNYQGTGNEEKAIVKGGFYNDWEEIPLTLATGNVWTHTREIPAGYYPYGFDVDGWQGDPLNRNPDGGDPRLSVPGISLNVPTKIVSGGSSVIEAVYYTGNKGDTDEVQLSLSKSLTGVTFDEESKTLSVASNTEEGTVEITAEYGEWSVTREIAITNTEYTYTINYYRYDGKASDWKLWLWHTNNKGSVEEFDTVVEDGIAQKTYTIPYNSINTKVRYDSLEREWADEGPDLFNIKIPEGQDSVEIWIVEKMGRVFYDKPDFDTIKPVQREVHFTYVSDETELEELQQWNIWAWSTGQSNGENKFSKFVDNKATAIIKIADGVEKMSYKLRKGGDGDDWSSVVRVDQDYDRDIITGSEITTKVIVTAGEREIYTLPASKPPVIRGGKATFTYRDQALYRAGKMDELQGVELNINGQTYPMVYVEKDELFTYTVSLPHEGVYEYTYKPDNSETEITDPVNTKDGKSVVEYKIVDLTLGATVYPTSISYNESAVITLTVDANEELNIDEAYADLSPLGGGQKEVIDETLLERSISVKDSVTAGAKTIKVTVVDQYGNEHSSNVTVDVKPRVSTGTLDFDWDEARIYFMLTDRFRNGDTSNDDPNGLNTRYPEHLEAYHGGDIKGITEKLDYLDKLGINTIWITPIVDNIDFDNRWTDPNNVQFGYHGYWAKNFETMDEHLGDVEDLQELIDKAHDRGIKIMVDVVLNHTGYGLKASDEGSGNGIPGYPTTEDRERFAGMLRTGGAGDVTGEVAGLPDFLTEVPEVRDQVIQWQVDWLEKARTERGDTIDYFRVDTIKHVEPTTLAAFKNELTKVKPDFKLIGENFGGTIENTGGYLGNGQMDSILDFGFNERAESFVNGSIDATQSYLENQNKLLSNDYTVGHFLSSHDEDGFLLVEVNGDIGKHKVAAALQITIKGQPVIYYGEELGQSGRNANMDNDIFSENRYDLAWDKVEDKDPEAMDIYTHYSKLLNFRDKYSKVISKGNHTKIAGSDASKYLVYGRSYQGTTAVIGLNTDEVAKTAVITTPYAPGTTIIDEYSDKNYTVDSSGKISISIPSRADGGTVLLAGKDYSPPASQEGGSGLVSPPTTTPTTPANEQSVTNPTANQGVVKVDVKPGITKVTLPASSSVWNDSNSLSLQSSDIDLNIPADVIAAALKLTASDKLNKSKISVAFNPVEDAEAAKQLQQAVAKNSAALKQLGESYQLSVSIVEENGTEKKLDKYSPPITVSFHVEKPSDSKLTGIYFIGENGELEYVGGTWSDKGISAQVSKPGTYVVLTYDKSFSDVPSSHWALEAIKQLAAQQIVNGVSDSQFAPSANVTRAEFAAILARALKLDTTSSGTATFSDVPASAWYVNAIAAASQAGLITGRADGTFGGNEQVTREEMAVMLIRAYSKATGNEQPSGSTTSLNDADEISSWANQAVQSAVALGLLQGRESGAFDPKSSLLRAESAQAIINLFQLLQSKK